MASPWRLEIVKGSNASPMLLVIFGADLRHASIDPSVEILELIDEAFACESAKITELGFSFFIHTHAPRHVEHEGITTQPSQRHYLP
jgi:hypothetical protein